MYKRNPEANRNRVGDETNNRIHDIPVHPFEPVDPLEVVRMGVPNRNPETALQLFNTMEVRMYSIAFNRWSQPECCICMESFNNRQIAIVSNWRHIYHPDCIKGYINRNFERNRRIKWSLLELSYIKINIILQLCNDFI